MSALMLQDHPSCRMTAVPDVFFDQYMPFANGEFVKVYLYLWKLTRDRAGSFDLSELADVFSCTESDILRALRYWEKQGLVRLSFTENGKLPSGVSFLPLPAVSREPEESRGDGHQTGVEPAAGESAAAAEPEKEVSAPHAISGSRAEALRENEEVRQLLFLTERYLGRTLSPTDVNRLLYFLDELDFPAELVEYLVEYCVSRGSRSMHYIERVGLAWHEQGIHTLEQAMRENSAWRRDYFPILKAFGIRGRNPVSREIEYMDRWLVEYGFSMELIQEACERTIEQIGQPSFQYAEGILSRWKKQGIRTMNDVQERDSEHKKKKDRESAPPSRDHGNRFNNFRQRQYDYGKLEEQLLKHP